MTGGNPVNTVKKIADIVIGQAVDMPPDPEEEHLLKNSRTKKLKTQWEISITQGKNSRFGQNLYFFTIKYVCFSSMPPLLPFNPIMVHCVRYFVSKRSDISMNFAKPSQYFEEKLKNSSKKLKVSANTETWFAKNGSKKQA